MPSPSLRTTVIGSYPFPAWLEYACQHLDQFGDADRAEMVDDAVSIALHDQLDAGLDVVTDGEQTRLDFNLSFYGFIDGLELESASSRRFGPPAHDQRGQHQQGAEHRADRKTRVARGAAEKPGRHRGSGSVGAVLGASARGTAARSVKHRRS